MKRDGASLTHRSQQAGLAISSSDVAHVLLHPLVQGRPHTLAGTLQGPACPRPLGRGELPDERHADVDGAAQVRYGDRGVEC